MNEAIKIIDALVSGLRKIESHVSKQFFNDRYTALKNAEFDLVTLGYISEETVKEFEESHVFPVALEPYRKK
jgi:hypothetical protein